MNLKLFGVLFSSEILCCVTGYKMKAYINLIYLKILEN